MAQPYLETNSKGLPEDFMDFVKNIDTFIYKHNGSESHIISNAFKGSNKKNPHDTQSKRIENRDDNILSTQKAALRDVLMMKLVSYYEDKYKISHDFQSTETRKYSTSIRKTIPNNSLFIESRNPAVREEMLEVDIL
ncbi:hypothetical protein evm_009366 [Chilo suppressalis]|nr:hypothetical protein evm_009366 [Chilo suppressalis]